MEDISGKHEAREAVITIILQRRLAQSFLHGACHCPAEIWKEELPEGRAVPQALKLP
jgi:hypothetical protein